MSSSSTANERRVGRVKWFNTRNGYGFLTDTQSAQDVFLHHTAIQVPDGVFRNLYTGEYVEYETSTTDTGKTVAVNITGVHGGPLMCQLPRGTPRPGYVARRPAPREDGVAAPRGRGGFGGRGRGRGGGRGTGRGRPQDTSA
jgi:CspA family cold shock protein